MKNRVMKSLILFLNLFLVMLVGCGKASKDKTVLSAQEQEASDGVYGAILIPVNGKFSNLVTGEAKISKYGDDFSVRVKLRDAPPGLHHQYLFTGASCPSLESDTNVDGYVDSEEVRINVGDVILPFDGDLSSQFAGSNSYPSGKSYYYKNDTSYDLMLSDLKLPDEVVNDLITKLNGKSLQLADRVVMIYGEGKNLPDTVSSSILPLACGVLIKVSDIPEYEETEVEETPTPTNNQGDNYRPRPRDPEPNPPSNDTFKPEPPKPTSWWGSIRERWRRWRERMRNWWNGELL